MSTAKAFEDAEVVWKPTENSGGNMRKFWRHISDKYKLKIDNYWDMHKWSVENLELFWSEIWNLSGVISSEPYEKVLDTSKKLAERPEWFSGAKLNYAENLLKYRDNRTAIIISGEDRATERISFAEVYRRTCQYSAAFKKLGLQINDRVVCYISNREEPLFAMMATTAAGAIWSGALPLLGVKAVVNRYKQIEPKFLLTLDRYVNDGEEKEMLSKVREIAANLPSLEKVIVVASNADSRSRDISDIRNSCYLDEFLALGENEDGTVSDIEFEQLSFSHPAFINYTSGTTGDPKALVHGIGTLLAFSKDMILHFNGTRDFTWLSMSPPGWVSWNIFSSFLAIGATVVLYEGVPYFLSPTFLWDMVDEFKITSLFLTPSTLDELEKKGYVPSDKNHLSSLDSVSSGGSVVTPQNFDFVYKKLKPDVKFGSAYGCTEIASAGIILDETLPIYKGEISAPSLGIRVCCYNEEGKHVDGELGNLVFANPNPSMPLCIWEDDSGELYKRAYFSKYPDAFTIGDSVMFNPFTKGIYVVGRNDDTLNQRGWRFGSSEIYNVVNTLEEVMDSLCVAQYSVHRLERAVLFLKMRIGHLCTDQLVSRIRESIAKELTKGHVPEVILEAPDVPMNLNGKKMEVIVKKILNDLPYNADNVKNDECLDFYKNLRLSRDFN